MPNIFDYLEWRGDVPFSADPFNEVDNLILSELSYTQFDGLIPDCGSVALKKVRKDFFENNSRAEIRSKTNPILRAPLLMDAMVTGRRFSEINLMNYADIFDADRDVQMSAITFLLNDGTAFVAFRGTDNSVIGWKEDFNLSYQRETGGQRSAVEYLNSTAAFTSRPLRVGGHSKGGHFAVYASAFAEDSVKDRIMAVYTNDGPGFRDEVMESDEYRSILPKVISIVPDTSIIGMLLTSESSHIVIKSSVKGFLQHDALSWQVKRNKFVRTELTDIAIFIREAQKDWLSKLDDKARESFVDTLFSVFEATGIETFGEMKDQKGKTAERIISMIQDLPRSKQKEFIHIIGELIQSSGQTAVSSLSEWIRNQTEI